jgi:hypothetical protein
MEETTQKPEGAAPGEQGPAEGAGQAQTAAGGESQALIDELTVLGERFVELLRVAWNSEQRKEIEGSLRTGLNALATNLEEGFRKVSESPQTKEVVGKAENVAESVGEKVRASKVTQELAEGLRKGLAALSEQMERWSAELKKQEAGEAAKPAEPAEAPSEAAQDIPIDKQA